MKNFAVLVSGILFGIGVTVSGMTNPMKVLNFLDLFGTFDASLIFVMVAALVVTMAGFHFILKRPSPFFDTDFHIPSITAIDARLLGGSALFGLGWGMTGFCPGPAFASLVFGNMLSYLFVAAMVIGMLVAKLLLPARTS